MYLHAMCACTEEVCASLHFSHDMVLMHMHTLHFHLQFCLEMILLLVSVENS